MKGLLLGESADPETVEEVKNIVRRDPMVASVHPPLTMHFAPDEILLNIVVDFHPDASRNAIGESIDRIEDDIRSRFPEIRRVFIEAEAAGRSRHRRRVKE